MKILPNYKSKGKSKKIENIIYNNSKSYNSNENGFVIIKFLSNNFKAPKYKDILETGSARVEAQSFFKNLQVAT